MIFFLQFIQYFIVWFFIICFCRSATFELKGLQPEIGYKIVLKAVNDKGYSNATIHHIFTLNNAQKHTGKLKLFF